MKKQLITVVIGVGISALTSCGPQQWNNSAEYLSAPSKSQADLGSASIGDYILDLPPSKVHAKDEATLQRQVAASTPKIDGEWSSLRLEGSQSAPRRDFLLSHRTKTLRMTVAADGNSPREVHQFRREASDWYHWIED